MEDYHWAIFTYAMEFFKECTSLKKPILEHFFTSSFNDLLTKDLVTLVNLLSIEFLKPRKQLYATPNKRTWLPQDLRNKALKQSVNCRMTGLASKP
jgi:hypothetical protein